MVEKYSNISKIHSGLGGISFYQEKGSWARGKGSCWTRGGRPGKELLWAKPKLNKLELREETLTKPINVRLAQICVWIFCIFTLFPSSAIKYTLKALTYLTYVLNSFPSCNAAFPTAHQMSKSRYAIISSNSTFPNQTSQFQMQTNHDS